jgi:site-specific DNA recombinase
VRNSAVRRPSALITTTNRWTEALRGLVDAVVLTPDEHGETLQIESRGNLAAMLGATVQTKRSLDSDDLSLQVSLVAGAGFEPATFGL